MFGCEGDAYIKGNFYVDGTKSRVSTTNNYGERLLYCYEMPSPIFGDIGEGVTDENGKCYIFIDDIFSETIDIGCSYQVFVQPYDKGECYISERTPLYFIVEGTPNMHFGWEIKATQNNYDTTRLEELIHENSDEHDYATESYEYLLDVIKVNGGNENEEY